MADSTTDASFGQYVSCFCQCDFDLWQADGFNTGNNCDKSKEIGFMSNTPESRIENLVSYLDRKHYQSGNSTNSFFRSGHLKSVD